MIELVEVVHWFMSPEKTVGKMYFMGRKGKKLFLGKVYQYPDTKKGYIKTDSGEELPFDDCDDFYAVEFEENWDTISPDNVYDLKVGDKVKSGKAIGKITALDCIGQYEAFHGDQEVTIEWENGRIQKDYCDQLGNVMVVGLKKKSR